MTIEITTTASRLGAIALLALAAFVPAGPARAAKTLDINVVLPETGGASFVGLGQKDSLEALAAYVNENGGIKGETLHFVFHDDQTSPQVAVQLTSQILSEHPAVVMGSSLVGECLAMAPLMKEGPVQYCLSPAIHPKEGSYSNDPNSSPE